MIRLILVATVALAVGFGAGMLYGSRNTVTLQNFSTASNSGKRVSGIAEQMHANFLTAMSRLNECEERERGGR